MQHQKGQTQKSKTWFFLLGVFGLALMSLSFNFQNSQEAQFARNQWKSLKPHSPHLDFGEVSLASLVSDKDQGASDNNQGGFNDILLNQILNPMNWQTLDPIRLGLPIPLTSSRTENTGAAGARGNIESQIVGATPSVGAATTQGATCIDCTAQTPTRSFQPAVTGATVREAVRVAREGAQEDAPAPQEAFYRKFQDHCRNIRPRESLRSASCHVQHFSQITRRCEKLAERASKGRSLQRNNREFLRDDEEFRRLNEEQKLCIKTADRFFERLISSLNGVLRLSSRAYTGVEDFYDRSEALELRDELIDSLGEAPIMAMRYLPKLMLITARGIHADAEMAGQICRSLNPSVCSDTLAKQWSLNYLLANQAHVPGTDAAHFATSVSELMRELVLKAHFDPSERFKAHQVAAYLTRMVQQNYYAVLQNPNAQASDTRVSGMDWVVELTRGVLGFPGGFPSRDLRNQRLNNRGTDVPALPLPFGFQNQAAIPESVVRQVLSPNALKFNLDDTNLRPGISSVPSSRLRVPPSRISRERRAMVRN